MVTTNDRTSTVTQSLSHSIEPTRMTTQLPEVDTPGLTDVRALVAAQWFSLQAAIMTWATANQLNDVPIPYGIKETTDFLQYLGEKAYEQAKARPVTQLAALAAGAKLATIVVWLIVISSPTLDGMGNFVFFLSGAIALIKLAQAGTTQTAEYIRPYLKVDPVDDGDES